jgi:hypothetical protein
MNRTDGGRRGVPVIGQNLEKLIDLNAAAQQRCFRPAPLSLRTTDDGLVRG